MSLFKNINIGNLIFERVNEQNIDIVRICNFMKISEEEVNETYQKKSLDTEVLLRWSKLLEYDFFRIYTQHMILYAPEMKGNNMDTTAKFSKLPNFRKNIYTSELIDFILEQIELKVMSKNEVIDLYRIPKTTLYKWIEKRKK